MNDVKILVKGQIFTAKFAFLVLQFKAHILCCPAKIYIPIYLYYSCGSNTYKFILNSPVLSELFTIYYASRGWVAWVSTMGMRHPIGHIELYNEMILFLSHNRLHHPQCINNSTTMTITTMTGCIILVSFQCLYLLTISFMYRFFCSAPITSDCNDILHVFLVSFSCFILFTWLIWASAVHGMNESFLQLLCK